MNKITASIALSLSLFLSACSPKPESIIADNILAVYENLLIEHKIDGLNKYINANGRTEEQQEQLLEQSLSIAQNMFTHDRAVTQLAVANIVIDVNDPTKATADLKIYKKNGSTEETKVNLDHIDNKWLINL